MSNVNLWIVTKEENCHKRECCFEKKMEMFMKMDCDKLTYKVQLYCSHTLCSVKAIKVGIHRTIVHMLWDWMWKTWERNFYWGNWSDSTNKECLQCLNYLYVLQTVRIGEWQWLALDGLKGLKKCSEKGCSPPRVDYGNNDIEIQKL